MEDRWYPAEKCGVAIDGNGNLLGEGREWDARDRLVSGGYGYDTVSLRVKMGVQTVLLDGIEEAREYGTEVKRYDHDPSRVDALLAQKTGAGKGYFVTDALGSVYGVVPAGEGHAVDEGVGGFTVGAQEEAALGAAPGDEIAPAGDDGARQGHGWLSVNEPTSCGATRGSVVPSKAETIMAQARSQVEQVLRQIDRMTDEQQCELLEAMLLKQRRPELGWGMIKGIRSTLPRRSEQQVKRDVDTGIQQVRREHSRAARA